MAEATPLALSRLIALSDFLVANPGVPIKEVAQHFGRTPRQVRRDVSFLAEAGFGDLLPGNTLEIDTEALEEDGVLVLHEPLGLDQAPTVTAEEVALVIYGLRVVASELGDEEGAAVASATKKLLGMAGRMEDPQRRDLDTISLLESTGRLVTLRKAIEERTSVEIDYVRGDGQRRVREIFPLGLTFEGHGWIVSAVLPVTFERRSFRLDRMADVQQTWKRRPSDRTLLARRVQPRPEATVIARLDEEASWMVNEIAGGDTRVGDGGIEVEFTVWDPAWMRTQLLALADYVQTVDPEKVLTDAGRFARDALGVWEAVMDVSAEGTN